MRIKKSLLVVVIGVSLLLASRINCHTEENQTPKSLIDDDENVRPYLIVKDKEFFNLITTPSDDGYFVFFGAGWCLHCRNFKPTFIQLAKLSVEKKLPINPQMILYDVLDRDTITTMFKINSYPTIFYIKNGRYCPYGGPRDLEPISEFFSREISREFCKDLPFSYPSIVEQFQNSIDEFMVQLKYEYEFYSREYPNATVIAMGIFGVCLLITIFGVLAFIKDSFCKSKSIRNQPVQVNITRDSKKSDTPRDSKRSEAPRDTKNIEKTEDQARNSKNQEETEETVNTKKRSKRD